MKLDPNLYLVREHHAEDIPFIYSCWLKGLYHGNDFFRKMKQQSFVEVYHKIIGSILGRQGTVVKVACLKEDEEVILAYAVYEHKNHTDVLHWVFTKEAWRKFGLATELVPKEITVCTNLTKVGASLKPKEWEFNPFIL